MWHDGVYTYLLGTALRNGVQQTVLNLPEQRQLVECVH